jgi:long-chain fatty acid transport protein
MKKLFVTATVLFFVLALVSVSSATNGYFSHGFSIKNEGLAGTGVALPLDSLATSMNPAGMAFVGTRIDVGLNVFNPNRGYTVSGNPSGFPRTFGLEPGTVESDSEWFVIPAFGANKMLNENSSLGIAIFGNGGMNTNYDKRTFGDPTSTRTGVDLMQLFITPSYAVKLHPKHAIGVSPIFAYQSFEAKGLRSFAGFSSDPSKLSNNDHDSSFGYGGRIGYLGEILPDLFLGASYQTRIYMTKFGDYKGLFAEHGNLDIPQNWTLGLAFKATPALIFAADIQKIYYSDVNSIHNPLLPNLAVSRLGDDNGAGFGWKDMSVFKAGVQWESSDVWTWRAGYSYGEQPTDSSQVLFNILAPGVIQNHVTAGFTRKICKNQGIDFAVMHAFSHSVLGPNPLEVPGQQTIRLRMNQWEASVGYSWTF